MKDILIPHNAFVKEHKKLIAILKKGSKKEQAKEAKEQMKELLKHMKK